MQALIARGVIGDFRAPDLIRFGITPLYLEEADIDRAVEVLIEIMASDAWDTPEYRTRKAVTRRLRPNPSADPLDWRRSVGASTISPMANTDVLLWKIAEADPEHLAIVDPDHEQMTFGELYAPPIRSCTPAGARVAAGTRSRRCCPTASNR